jgi:peptide/nickel transport system permease protein
MAESGALPSAPVSPDQPVIKPPSSVGPKGRGRWQARMADFKRTWYFFRRNTLAVVGLAILIFFAVIFIYGYVYPAPATSSVNYCATDGPPPGFCTPGQPMVCTYPVGTSSPGAGCYQTPDAFNNFIAPTVSFSPLALGPLPMGSLVSPTAGGTAVDQGHFFNLYDLLLKGTDWSITISVAIVFAGAFIGLMFGAMAGYYGGLIDEVLMRMTDIFLSIPGILLIIVIVIAGREVGISGFDDDVALIIGAFIVTWWPTYTRIVRSQSLVVREQKYVEAARASGASNSRILRKHVIPNSVFPVFIQMSLDVGTVPLTLAAIAYLGFIIFPTQMIPEWGSVAAAATEVIPSLFNYCATVTSSCIIPWWQIFFPGVALFLFAISVNLLADGLRDALDPRLRR